MSLDSDSAIHSVRRLLLSHHPPEHSHRTITLLKGRYKFRICSRCLGCVIGFLLLTAFLWISSGNLSTWNRWFALCLVLLSPTPAIVDFHGQLMGTWESTNLRRILTGMILGAGISLSIFQVSTGDYLFIAPVPFVIGLYFAWAALNRRRAAHLLKHLRMYAKYYERCCAEDARRTVHKVSEK